MMGSQAPNTPNGFAHDPHNPPPTTAGASAALVDPVAVDTDASQHNPTPPPRDTPTPPLRGDGPSSEDFVSTDSSDGNDERETWPALPSKAAPAVHPRIGLKEPSAGCAGVSKWAGQLKKLGDMGFTDTIENERLLKLHNGALPFVIAGLL